MGTSPPGGLRSRRRATAAALVLVAVLAGCAAEPEHRYVASADRSMVVKVPSTWADVDAEEVGATTSGDLWRGYLDSSLSPSAQHFVDPNTPVSAPVDPVVEMLTLKIDEGTPVPPEQLADVILPASSREVTKLARQAYLDAVDQFGFGVLETESVETATATGVRVRTGFNFGGDDILVEKIAVTDKDSRHLHVIQVWCVRACFEKNQPQIAAVLDSFTVKQV
jgi:hypothetical protein